MPRFSRICASSSSSEMAEEATCRDCDRVLPMTEYNMHSGTVSGHRHECRECQRVYNQNYQQKKRDEREAHDEPDPQAKRSKFFESAVAGADLYVMAISTDPEGTTHGLKVGCSSNIPQRAANLSESLPFNILVLATFPGAGHLEKGIHSQLETTRNTTGRGREWFHATLPNITHAVACAMQSSSKTNAGPSGSS
jgi:hypothetical protein